MGYTKRDEVRSVELAGALSPTRINRLTTGEGFGLPTGVAWLVFGSVLAGLTGRGRDLDIAAVRLAAEHGWYTDRLRRVVQSPATEERAELIFGHLVDLAQDAARAEVAAGHRPDKEAFRRKAGERGDKKGDVTAALEEQAQITVETLKADLEDTWEGDPGATFEDGAQVSRRIAISLNGPPDPGREDVYADEFAWWVRTFAGRLRDGPQWAKKATERELVQSVQLANAFWRLTVLDKLGLGEEDAWRMIAALSPAASAWVAAAHEIATQVRTDSPVLPPFPNISFH